MKANMLAQNLLLQIPDAPPVVLSKELMAVARAPLLFQEGLLFFAAEQGTVWPGPYHDPYLNATVLEADSSQIHMDSFDTISSELEALQKALLYTRELAANIRQVTPLPVTVLISTEGEPYIGAVVRFHLTRSGEQWGSEDLERYIQPVLMLEI